mmetsp:Transcript_16663/g.43247  ORF Transcript_16663/g.43247 Transcript_16663/m.43247 type:complete len:204 (-) Transcript_16663:1-612(-)
MAMRCGIIGDVVGDPPPPLAAAESVLKRANRGLSRAVARGFPGAVDAFRKMDLGDPAAPASCPRRGGAGAAGDSSALCLSSSKWRSTTANVGLAARSAEVHRATMSSMGLGKSPQPLNWRVPFFAMVMILASVVWPYGTAPHVHSSHSVTPNDHTSASAVVRRLRTGPGLPHCAGSLATIVRTSGASHRNGTASRSTLGFFTQ